LEGDRKGAKLFKMGLLREKFKVNKREKELVQADFTKLGQ